jgi:hypothetical protein
LQASERLGLLAEQVRALESAQAMQVPKERARPGGQERQREATLVESKKIAQLRQVLTHWNNAALSKMYPWMA